MQRNNRDFAHAGVQSIVTADVHALDSFRRKTFWRLEQRDGDYYAFVADRMAEGIQLLDGRKAYDQLTGGNGDAFVEAYARIQNWVAELPGSERGLWTDERMVSEALHKLFIDRVDPDAVIEAEGNLLVTAGITVFLGLLIGSGGTAYSNANAYLGVGDSSTAAAVGQTDLQAATNKLRKAMNATYPTVSAPTINFQSSFGSSEANFTWAEVATFNASSGATMLNRVVQALGTKSSGATWTLTETVTWS